MIETRVWIIPEPLYILRLYTGYGGSGLEHRRRKRGKPKPPKPSVLYFYLTLV
jgi:hypothetical protein